jgi:4-hydroxybenzoate polyprenyltransferase
MPQTHFKPLFLFVIASNSLLLTGSLVNGVFEWPQIILMQWCGFCGVFIIYRFNDLIDQSHDLRFNSRNLLHHKWHLLFLVQFVLFTIPAVFYFLSPFRIFLLSAICLLGIFYSINFKLDNKNYRVKNYFGVKNIFIGVLKGSLIFAGAGGFTNRLAVALFVFAGLQVLIGSSIRDIPDIEKDKKEGVKSFAVTLGVEKTIGLLHFLNLISFIAGYLIVQDNFFILLMSLTISWRFILLVKIRTHAHSRLWTQTFNLLTTVLIFAITLFSFIYSILC